MFVLIRIAEPNEPPLLELTRIQISGCIAAARDRRIVLPCDVDVAPTSSNRRAAGIARVRGYPYR